MLRFRTIILIDDDSISNFITEKLVLREQLAHKVVTFLTAEGALSHLQELIVQEPAHFPEVILLDLNMPGMDGWEFIEEYKKLPATHTSNCRLYMLSSAVDSKDIVMAKNISEVEDFISKPLTKEDIEIIREQLMNSNF